MTDRPPSKPSWLDLLLTAWVVVFGVVYFGGYFVPAIGALTPNASAFYALMVLVTVLVLTLRFLRRADPDPKKPDMKPDMKKNTRTKNRK